MQPPNLDSMVTDFGNERRMLASHQGDILYDRPNKTWYLWNPKGGLWEADSKGKIEEMVKEMIRGIQAEADAMKEKASSVDVSTEEGKTKRESLDGVAKALFKWAKNCQNPARIKACLELLQSSVAVSPEDFNKNPKLFNCQNGTFNLETGKLRPHNKEDRITYSCGWNHDEKADCPNFKKFLGRLFQSHADKNDLIRFVRMGLGYALSGDTDQQIINMITGSGNNGKSVLMETMAATFGDYADSLNGESLTTLSRGKIREDLAKLVGKRFVRVSESGKGAAIDEEIVKHLTGGSREPLVVRNLYGKSFDFFPKCKIFWSFNHPPTVKDMTNSIWRRIKMTPCNEIITDAEKREMDEIIKEHDAERSGIINWLYEGYKDLKDTGNFNWCKAVQTRTDEYKEDVDTLRPFMDEVTEKSDADKVKSMDLFDLYCGWAYEHGYTRPLSLTGFGTEIVERIGRENRKKETHGVFYYGIKIRDGVHYLNPRKHLGISSSKNAAPA